MKLEVDRHRILIIPECRNEQDIAYIEDTLGLKKEGDCIKLKRVNVMGFSRVAYLEAKKEKCDG